MHFLLPVYFPWSDHLEGMYEPLPWALFTTTVFFGGVHLVGLRRWLRPADDRLS